MQSLLLAALNYSADPALKNVKQKTQNALIAQRKIIQ
jgi:hypothetical protein